MIHYNNLINALCDALKELLMKNIKIFLLINIKIEIKLKKRKKNDNLISVLYFDEMGLTEISPNNLLKVIHSQLEYDENEDSKKIAFVVFQIGV